MFAACRPQCFGEGVLETPVSNDIQLDVLLWVLLHASRESHVWLLIEALAIRLAQQTSKSVQQQHMGSLQR